MNSTSTDAFAIAIAEFNEYLEQQANLIAPEIPALVPAPITVERVGLTKNMSRTPYIRLRSICREKGNGFGEKEVSNHARL